MTRIRFLAALLVLLAAGVTAAQAAPPVVMYATSWCPYCAKARAHFARKRTPTWSTTSRNPPPRTRGSSASAAGASR